MKLTIRRVNIERLYKTLHSIGYHPIKIDDKKSEWRRGSFHIYAFPWAKRGVKLKLHRDIWKHSPPNFEHKVKTQGKDIEQELQRIQQKYQTVRNHSGKF